MDADAQPFLTQEKKYVLVDSYVKCASRTRSSTFLTVGGSESGARQRLEQLTNSGLRDEVNKRPVKSVVSTDRAKIMQIVTAAADAEARKFGIEVVDVRLQRVDLPDEVSQSVYQRMKAERSRIANELRAQGRRGGGENPRRGRTQTRSHARGCLPQGRNHARRGATPAPPPFTAPPPAGRRSFIRFTAASALIRKALKRRTTS